MEQIIKVSYKSTSNPYQANKFLQEIKQHNIMACDFEVATKYLPAELGSLQQELDNNPAKRRSIEIQSILKATALDHPSHTQLTHCSIATNDHEGYVFILDNKRITDLVLTFLTTTTIRQVWHNASYDFRQIRYRTKKFPLLYEDTQILAKTILNHADVTQALSGLKHLVGHRYGAWGISADQFTLEQMYDPTMLLYAATDACACYYLWDSIQQYIKDNSVREA